MAQVRRIKRNHQHLVYRSKQTEQGDHTLAIVVFMFAEKKEEEAKEEDMDAVI